MQITTAAVIGYDAVLLSNFVISPAIESDLAQNIEHHQAASIKTDLIKNQTYDLHFER